MTAWNPHYEAYAAAQGRTADEQAALNRGGAEFMSWISEQFREWRAATGAGESLTNSQHDAFTAWLANTWAHSSDTVGQPDGLVRQLRADRDELRGKLRSLHRPTAKEGPVAGWRWVQCTCGWKSAPARMTKEDAFELWEAHVGDEVGLTRAPDVMPEAWRSEVDGCG